MDVSETAMWEVKGKFTVEQATKAQRGGGEV